MNSIMLIYHFANSCEDSGMDIKEIRKLNLSSLLNQKKSYSQAAKDWDTAPSMISQIMSEKGQRNLGDVLARKIELAEGLERGWFDILHDSESKQSNAEDEVSFIGGFDAWDSDTPLGEDEVEIPLFREVELAAGEGRTQVVESQGCKLRFAKSTFRKAGILPANAACCFVSGDSMEPAMPDGTTVGVDTQDVTVRDGKTYVIDHDGMLRVKMLYRLPGGGIRVRSMNPNKVEFPDEDYHAGWQHYIKIKGRVFWSSTMW